MKTKVKLSLTRAVKSVIKKGKGGFPYKASFLLYIYYYYALKFTVSHYACSCSINA